MAWELKLSGPTLEELYAWTDQIPISKPRRKIERDFADGTMVAEIVRHYLPDMVNLHNYVPNSSFTQKKINWATLNRKVFERFEFDVPETIIRDLCNAKPGTIELLLFNLRPKINQELELRQKKHQPQQQQQKTVSPRQPLRSVNTSSSKKNDVKSVLPQRTSRTSRSVGNNSNKSISRLDYEELKQQCLEQEEEIQVLQVQMRRLEHVAQLKDVRITELAATIKDCSHIKSTTVAVSKYKKK